MMLIGDTLRRNARLNTHKICIVDGKNSFTYGELNQRTNRLANALLELGLKKGDKIAFLGNNSHEFVEYYYALSKYGFISVPINARFQGDEVFHILINSECIAIIYHEDVENNIKNIDIALTKIKWQIYIGKKRNDHILYEDLIESGSNKEPVADIGPDDIALIMYTSGATGFPKGVITTQKNIMANTNTMCLELDIVPEDITVLVMPLYHNGGLWPTMSSFYRGGKIILLPKYDIEEMLKIIQEEKVTFLNLVPTMLIRLISHSKLYSYNIDSLRLIMYAGAPISLKHLKKAMSILGPNRFYGGLGCTEASGNLISFRTTEHALYGEKSKKLGSVGKDAMGVEIKIVDENGNELPPNKVGEIIGKGDNITKGYYKLPEETAEAFRNEWLYTGDLGYRDEDGYIFVVDRKKDIIISGGENISSKEVEEVIYQHPDVKEVAVIGVPDEEWGEAVKGVIVLKNSTEIKGKEKSIIDFCKKRLAGYKKPKIIEFIEELPKNSAGKINKAILKEKYKIQY